MVAMSVKGSPRHTTLTKIWNKTSAASHAVTSHTFTSATDGECCVQWRWSTYRI